jgi:hypothetical protein
MVEKIKKTRYKVSDTKLAFALRQSGGYLSQAAKILGFSVGQLKERIRREPKLQEIIEETTDVYLDLAEHELIKKIKAGDLIAIMFYLKCRGKQRGYVERMEKRLEVANNIEERVQSFRSDLSLLSDSELLALESKIGVSKN